MSTHGIRASDAALTKGSLVAAALRVLSRQPRQAWAAWGVLLAAGLALDFSARAVGVDVGGMRVDAGLWAYSALEDLLTAAASGWALCWLLTGAAPKEKGYGVFVLLLALTELYWDATAHLFPDDSASAVEVIGGSLAVAAMVAGGVFVFTRLLLWPIGHLTGGSINPAGSWARMEGQVLRYFGAVVLLTFPVIALNRGIATLETALATLLSAVMWRRRQGASSERLADVFA